jgi:hypothetical protein
MRKINLNGFKYLRFWRVPFFDWLWFVFYLGCDEFSHKLHSREFRYGRKDILKMRNDRKRAHRIEELLSE